MKRSVVDFLSCLTEIEVLAENPIARRKRRVHLKKLEPMVGVEPTTSGLRYRCSTTELHRLNPHAG